MENELSLSLQKTFESKCDEALEEIVTSDIPSLIDGTSFCGVPILSSIASLFKIGKTIHDTLHIRKIARFLLEIIKGKETKQLQQYVEKIKEDDDFAEKEIEYIVVILDRYFEDEKASVLGRLYLAFLEKKIDWKNFKTFSAALDTIFIDDIAILKLVEFSTYENGDEKTASIARLQSVGFLLEKMHETNFTHDQLHTLSITKDPFRRYIVTRFGRLFYQLISSK